MSACTTTLTLPPDGSQVKYTFPAECTAIYTSLVITRILSDSSNFITIVLLDSSNREIGVVDLVGTTSGIDVTSATAANVINIAPRTLDIAFTATEPNATVGMTFSIDYSSVILTPTVDTCGGASFIPGFFTFPSGCTASNQITVTFSITGADIGLVIAYNNGKSGSSTLTVASNPSRITNISNTTGDIIVLRQTGSDLSVNIVPTFSSTAPVILVTISSDFTYAILTLSTLAAACVISGKTDGTTYTFGRPCYPGGSVSFRFRQIGSGSGSSPDIDMRLSTPRGPYLNIQYDALSNTITNADSRNRYGSFLLITGPRSMMVTYTASPNVVFDIVFSDFMTFTAVMEKAPTSISSSFDTTMTNTMITTSGTIPLDIPFDCSHIFIETTGTLNPNTYDMLYVEYEVLDCEYHGCKSNRTSSCNEECCGLGKYKGNTVRVTKDAGFGTIIQVLNLEVVSVIEGDGTVKDKAINLGVEYGVILLYILTKIIMGRLVLYGEITLKSALTQNYGRLMKAINCSRYRRILTYFCENKGLEQYLR